MRRAALGGAKQDFIDELYDTLDEAIEDNNDFIESRLKRFSAENTDYQTFKVNTNWEEAAYQNNPVLQQYDLNFNWRE